MGNSIDITTAFTLSRIESGDAVKNLTENTEHVVWWVKNAYKIKLSPTKEFSEILKKYKGF